MRRDSPPATTITDLLRGSNTPSLLSSSCQKTVALAELLAGAIFHGRGPRIEWLKSRIDCGPGMSEWGSCAPLVEKNASAYFTISGDEFLPELFGIGLTPAKNGLLRRSSRIEEPFSDRLSTVRRPFCVLGISPEKSWLIPIWIMSFHDLPSRVHVVAARQKRPRRKRNVRS